MPSELCARSPYASAYFSLSHGKEYSNQSVSLTRSAAFQTQAEARQRQLSDLRAQQALAKAEDGSRLFQVEHLSRVLLPDGAVPCDVLPFLRAYLRDVFRCETLDGAGG